jgi:hypothetical protein
MDEEVHEAMEEPPRSDEDGDSRLTEQAYYPRNWSDRGTGPDPGTPYFSFQPVRPIFNLFPQGVGSKVAVQMPGFPRNPLTRCGVWLAETSYWAGASRKTPGSIRK